MSRIGKRPIEMPAGVSITIDGAAVTVKGPKGTLSRVLPADIKVSVEGSVIAVERPSEATRHKALHGLTRTLVANMVEGVSKGYTKTLEIQGVGYKAELKPFGVNLVVGLSHQVPIKAPEGIKFVVETPTVLKVEGINKELVGQVAAEIRSVRPPEPYKGKGIRYQGEQVRRKAGKTGAK
jgi:large subunit ribosomal protein L6